MRNEKGFTLVELMVVVAIIAILAAVAIPQMGLQIKKSKDSAGLGLVGAMRSAVSVYMTDHDGEFAANLNLLDNTTYIDNTTAEKVVVAAGAAVGGVVVGTTKVAADDITHVDANPITDDAVDATQIIEANAAITLTYNTTDGTILLSGGNDGTAAPSTTPAFDTKGNSWITY